MLTKLTRLAVISCAILLFASEGFAQKGLNFPRVRKAEQTKGSESRKLLADKGISASSYNLFIRAFKTEKLLEVWAKNTADNSYQLVKTYDFCASSGSLGPKRRSGDRQTPEGFYKVDFFNPNSNYHLSFRINYPNASDAVLSDKLNPGDNIFIHGDCVTIGCIPIGNDQIDELYLLAVKAAGDVNVHIFPAKMTDANMATLSDPAHQAFWKSLKAGHDAFESTKTLPNVTVGADGSYSVK